MWTRLFPDASEEGKRSPQQPLHFLIRRLVEDSVESAHGPGEARDAQADHPVSLFAQLFDSVGRAHGDGQDELLKTSILLIARYLTLMPIDWTLDKELVAKRESLG